MVVTEAPSQATANVMQERAGEPSDQDRAGPAHAVLAADVRAGQELMAAQKVREMGAGLDRCPDRAAVDRQRKISHEAQACRAARSSATTKSFRLYSSVMPFRRACSGPRFDRAAKQAPVRTGRQKSARHPERRWAQSRSPRSRRGIFSARDRADGTDRMRELSRLLAELVESQRAPPDSFGTRMARISSSG